MTSSWSLILQLGAYFVYGLTNLDRFALQESKSTVVYRLLGKDLLQIQIQVCIEKIVVWPGEKGRWTAPSNPLLFPRFQCASLEMAAQSWLRETDEERTSASANCGFIRRSFKIIKRGRRRRIEKLKPSQETGWWVGSKKAFRTQSRIHNSPVTECYKKQLTKLQN